MDNLNKVNLGKNLIGRFYFKRTQNGNLIGEFSHNRSLRNSSESADVTKANEHFVGEYNTSWQENGKAMYANLTIEYKPSTGNSILTLKWTSKTGKFLFLGEGFLFDGILIGDYRDFEII